MRVINDFRCNGCDKTEERLIHHAVKNIPCDCGDEMTKVMVAPRIGLDGTDPAFPTAYDKWANVREQNARVRSRRSDLE